MTNTKGVKHATTTKKTNEMLNCENITFPSLGRFQGGERQAEKLRRLSAERQRLRVDAELEIVKE